MFEKIVVLEPILMTEEGKEELKSYAKEIIYYDTKPTSEEEVIERIKNADCVLLLKEKPSAGFLDFFFKWFDKTFENVTNFYVKQVNLFLNNKVIAFTVIAVIVAGTIFLFKKVPSTLVPDEDQGVIIGVLMLDQASSLNNTIVATKKAEEILLQFLLYQDRQAYIVSQKAPFSCLVLQMQGLQKSRQSPLRRQLHHIHLLREFSNHSEQYIRR